METSSFKKERESSAADIEQKSCINIEIPYNVIRYLSTDECDIQALCRICFSIDNKEMYPLYVTQDYELLPEMFTAFTAISVYQDDGLPSYICELCRLQVETCYEFKFKCIKSDSTLRSFLKGEFETKHEENDSKVTHIETSDEQDVSADNKFKLEEADDLNEDVQYLEDVSDIGSDCENLCILQDINKTEEKQLSVNITSTEKIKNVNELRPKKSKKLKSHICSFCSKRFVNIRTLKTHMKRIHSGAKHPHSCNLCKASFNTNHDLELHVAIHSKGPIWKCVDCSKEFLAKSILRRHIQRHMESKRYSCEVCGKPFAELYALRRHARVHTGESVEKRHACHMCDKRYSESNLLAAHIARHNGERPCVCAICGKGFPSTRLLTSHHLVHSEDKPYACRYCDKRFRHESTRNTHHRTHTGEKPYVCTFCGKTFIQNSNLTLHMRTHTGEKPYSCNTCGREFSSGSSLKTHMRSHTGEKPYSCDVCNKKFARADLSAHMRQHTGERPFACAVCARKFTRASRLRDHCRVHTGERPFECVICPQKFSTKSLLVKHMKTHHSKKKVERKVVIVREVDYDQPYVVADKFVITRNKDSKDQCLEENVKPIENDDEIYNKDSLGEEVPLEVTGELVLQDEDDMKTNLLVVNDDQTNGNFENGSLCLSTNDVNFVNNDMNYANDVNLVTVNEGEVSISSSSAMLEGTTVKLYQLDQSLVQIHSVGGQVTISKITSKMTANF